MPSARCSQTSSCACAGLGERPHLATHLAQQHPEDGGLAAQHLAQPLELLGVGIAASAAAQRATLALVRHLELQAGALRLPDDLLAGHLQQAAVGGVCHGLLLHGGVHYHALELGGLDGLDGRRRLNGGLEQMLNACLAQHNAVKAVDLRCVARQFALVVLHAA